MFDKKTVEEVLRKRGWELPFEVYDEIDSTNLAAKRLVRDGRFPDGGLVLADKQTSGKGRLGRAWSSVPGKDLTFTLVFPNELNPVDIPKTSLAASLGICEALSKEYSIAANLKWPNDILLDGHKFCGILSEYITPENFLIIGIGLNVNSGKPDWNFPSVTPPASLRDAVGEDIERAPLLASCAVSIRDFLPFAKWEYFPTLQTLYQTRAFYTNKRVTIFPDALTHADSKPDSENVIEGIALGIDRYGALLVRDDFGHDHSVRAGDMVLMAG